MFELVRKGLSDPERIPSYLREKSLDKVHGGLYKWNKNIPDHKDLIHDFIQKEEFAIIILDACRYDMFRSHFDEYFSGKLESAWSSAGWTGAYVENTWTENYDFTYLGAATHVSDHSFEYRNKDYRPSDHIDRIIQLWNTDWNPVYGTVHPQKVTDAALAEAARSSQTKMVVHYMQPHSPYIGDTKILPWGIDKKYDEESLSRLAREAAERTEGDNEGSNEHIDDLDPADIDLETVVEYDIGPRQFQQWEEARPSDSIQSRIRSGEISDEELRQAYRDNLQLVLSEVDRLISRLNCDIVVTADHGEFLGESNRYFHPNTDHPLVREIPWLQVSEECIGNLSIEEEYRNMNLEDMVEVDQVKDETFEKRLEALGYIN